MSIFTRDLSHQIIAYVLLSLFLFQFLPYVTCQQELLDSPDGNGKTKVSVESVIGIILLAMFLLSLVVCCLHYGFFSEEIETEGQEVSNSIVRRGIDKDIIETFPSFLYSEVKGLKIGKGGVECAICLSEFEDKESLRWMPPCSHTFHANCIDVWLSSRSTCPVCRASLSLKPGESFPYPSMDLEAQRGVIESPSEISLTGNGVTWNNDANYKTPRSSSTGLLSSWRMAEIFIPRSHSDGHQLVQLGENLDRFTMQLPEEVQRQLVSLNLITRSHIALPRARSSRQGYRSGSVGIERSSFSQGRQTLRRAISTSLAFSFNAAPIRSTVGRDDQTQETSQAKDREFGERSFQRLIPEKV